MFDFFKSLRWFPPAETEIPWSAILSAFGRQCAKFENDLCRYIDVDHCILGESARTLLFVLLEELKKVDNGRRHEVLIPGYTCYSVAAAVAKANLKISIYDLDPKTFCADLDSLEKAVSENTLAVITQHLFGILTPIDKLKIITHQKGAYLIEDSAQALGRVEKRNGQTRTLGDFGLFSFGRGKPLPVGGGGALVSRSHAEIINKITFNRNKKGYRHAFLSATTQIVSNPALYWIPEMLPLGLGETKFNPEFHIEGMAYTLENISIAALPTLDRLNEHRNCLSNLYSEHLEAKYQKKDTGIAVSIIRFPVLLPNTILTKEMKRMGVRRMYPKAIFDESSIRPYLKQGQDATFGASEISAKLFTLPTHLRISESMAKKLAVLVQEEVRLK